MVKVRWILSSLILLFFITPCFAGEYWVYTRLEDRSGLTLGDDPGRSKREDVVAIYPVTPQFVPTKREKEAYLIFRTELTDTQVRELRKPWKEEKLVERDMSIRKKNWEDLGVRQSYLEDSKIRRLISVKDEGKYYRLIADVGEEYTKAYRRNKLDLVQLGVAIKKGLVPTKIESNKIRYSQKTAIDIARYRRKQKIFAYLQYPLIRLANIVLPFLYADVTKTINKGVGVEDYNSLTLWEDDRDGVLTETQIGECWTTDGTLTESSFTIDGSTTDATKFMHVTAAVGERHNGASGGFTLITTDGSDVIFIDDPYTVIEWMHINNWTIGAFADVDAISIAGAGDNATIRYNLIQGGDNQDTNARGEGLEMEGATFAYRNIVKNMDGQNDAVSSGINHGFDDENYTINNNTVIDCEICYDCENPDGNDDAIANNNIGMDFRDEFDFAAAGCYNSDTPGDKNLSSDGTAPGANGILNKSSADQFVNAATDLHLKAGADAIDAGDDLGSPYDTDIDNESVTGTWDVGADELVSAAVAGADIFFGINF